MTKARQFALTLAIMLCGITAFARGAHAQSPVNTNGTRWAIGGFDVVAYFTDHRPTRGTETFSAQWSGATWLFASDAHRRSFLAAPARFAPTYGGYCAYAIAQGNLVRIDPQAWAVIGGHLYLNYSLDIRTRWNAGRDAYIRDANARWPALSRRH